MKTKTEFLVCQTLDPYSDCTPFSEIEKARKMAEQVGHFHVFEYEVTPGTPGVTPDESELIANHYVESGVWVRDVAEVSA